MARTVGMSVKQDKELEPKVEKLKKENAALKKEIAKLKEQTKKEDTEKQ